MRLIILVALIVLLACNQASQSPNAVTSANQQQVWDSATRFEFINACMEEQQQAPVSDTITYSYCKCMLEQIERKYPTPDSIPAIDSITLQQMQRNCLK